MQTENGTASSDKKCLIIVYSYHHNNTAKIAGQFANVLHARIKTPDQVVVEDLHQYDLIGFGAGIDSGKHYIQLLDLADKLPEENKKPCFIFSTSTIQGESKVEKDHSTLRQKLQLKGYIIIDEFSCKGFNTNSFLRYIGGINKGRPNSEDLRNAEIFALKLLNRS